MELTSGTALSPEVIGSYAPDAGRYRPRRWPAWIDEIDFSVSDAHVRMGTRSLAPTEWLAPDELAPSELALRQRLVLEQRQHVVACGAVAEDAAAETERLMARWRAEQSLEITAAPGAGDDAHPLVRAGTTGQEDLCLLVHHDGQWHLEAAVLCFPSMWTLAEKIGRPIRQVHAPVPHYAEELGQRVDTFFDRLPPGRLVRRRNVSVWPACLLWVPTATLDASLWDDPPGDPTWPMLWLRSERQTLRRLPDSGAILFTIRVQMAPLSVLAQRPDRARDLAAWLRAPGGESRRQQLGATLSRDLAWLDRTAAAQPGG